jgi:hypothetical protein
LERSFDRSNLLAEVLTLAFGERHAGLLLALGLAMQSAARLTALTQDRRIEDWTSDPDAYYKAFRAAFILDNLAQPTEKISARSKGQGSYCARALVRGLSSTNNGSLPGDVPIDTFVQHAGTLRQLLGPIATRMSEELPRLEERMKERQEVIEEGDTRRQDKQKKYMEALGDGATATELSLLAMADNTVEMVQSSLKPSSPEELAALLEKLQSNLNVHIASNAPTKTSGKGSNPFRLAIAVYAATSELEGFVNEQSGFPPTEPVVSILEKHLGMFLRPDWEQRGQANEGNDSQAGQEELAAQIRRRA